MKNMRIWTALFLLILVPAPALGIDMDFYTYNGFDETVAMFTRLALVFSDGGFRTFFMIFAVVGIIASILGPALMGALSGTGTNPAAGLIPIIIGIAVVRGLVFPTGNVIVYDPVRNATATVPNVPDLIVLFAGGLNVIERGLVSIIETAGANPYMDMSSSISYSLIRAANRTDLNDYYLEQSLVNYYLNCGVPALGHGSTNRRQRLLHNTENLMNEFAEWKNVALFTTYHLPGSDAGELRSCAEAWDDSDGLKARLNRTSTFDDYTASVCESAGFNVGATAQLTQCKSALARATGLFGVNGTNEVPLLRAMIMAKSVSSALNSADFSQAQRTLINRQVIAEGFGTSQAMDQWIPKVRVFLTVVALGCVPIVVLFLVTPAYQAAMILLLGLFSWLAMWGVCDAMAVQMAQDASLDAFNGIQRQKLGIDAILQSPEAAVQALGVFGKARMVAITLATVLSGALFKFGGYAFARLGEQWQSHLEQAGERAGRQTMLPEEKAQFQRSLVGSVAHEGAMSQVGFDHMAGGQAMSDLYQGKTSSYISNELGMNAGQYNALQARSTAVNTVGTDRGYEAAAERAGLGYADSAIGAISQSAGESHVGALTRRDVGRDFYSDSLKPAEQEAKFGVARTAATDDAVSAFKGAQGVSDGEALRGTFRVLGAGEIANAGEFSPSEAIAAKGFAAQSENSFTQAMAERGVSGSDAGRADAYFKGAQTNATLRAGPDAIENAEMLNRGELTGRAAVANEVSGGDPFGHGRGLGTRQGSIGAAELWRDQSVAQGLGLNPNEIRDNVQYQSMSHSQVQLGLSSDMASRVAENQNADLSPEQRRFMRENPDAGYAMNFHLNQDGNWTAGSMKTGIDLSSGNFSHFRDGTSQEQIYTVSESAGGGNRLLGEGHIETLMERAFNLDGSVNQSSLAAFGKAYGEALSDRGFTLSRQHADELRDHVNTSVHGSGGLEAKGGFKVLGIDVSGHLGGGLRQSRDKSDGWSSTDSVHENRNLLLMQSLGSSAMERAKTEYKDQNGALPPSDSNASGQIYARASDLFKEDFESLVNKSQARVDKTSDESGTDESGRGGDRGDKTWRPESARW